MKFSMLRKDFHFKRKQGSLKRRDQHIRHEDHGDYTYLTNIPDIDLDAVNEAFDCFCRLIFGKIKDEERYSTDDYFTEIDLHLDDATGNWTFNFRFDEFVLAKEYEIDTDAEITEPNDTANNTPTSNGNTVYSALVAGSGNDLI